MSADLDELIVELDADEAEFVARLSRCSDASVSAHMRLGRTRVEGTTLYAHPKWMAEPVLEHLDLIADIGGGAAKELARRALDKISAAITARAEEVR